MFSLQILIQILIFFILLTQIIFTDTNFYIHESGNHLLSNEIWNNKPNYNHLNNFQSLELDSDSFYIHGDFDAVSYMKFETNLHSNEENKLSIGLKSDVTKDNITHLCISNNFILAATIHRDIIFVGQVNTLLGESKLKSKPRILWNVDESIGNIAQLECGDNHAFLRTDKNLLFAFGSGNKDQFGLGIGMTQASTFLKHYFLSQVKFVTTSKDKSLLIDHLGHVYINDQFYYKNRIFQNRTRFESPWNETTISKATFSFDNVFLLGDDNCLYLYKYYSLNPATKLNMDCNIKSISCEANSYLNECYLTTTNQLLLSFNPTSKDIENLFENVDSEIIRVILKNNNFIGIQLSNGTVLAKILDSSFYNFELNSSWSQLLLPNQENLNKFVKLIACNDKNCAVVDQFEGLYTLGVRSIISCNFDTENLTSCYNYNTKELETEIKYSVPFIFEKGYYIGVFSKKNKLDLYTIDFNLETTTKAVNLYPHHNSKSTILVFTSNYLDILIAPLSTTLEVDLTKFQDFININGHERDKKLNSFLDFQSVTVFISDNWLFKIYHIARGKFSRGLAIHKQNIDNRNLTIYISNIERFWIDQYNYLSAIGDNCTILISTNTLENSLQYNYYSPHSTCHILKKIISLANSGYVLSSEGKVFKYTINIFTQNYNLEELEILQNITVVDITSSKINGINFNFYAMTDQGDIYHIINNNKTLIKLPRITRMQPYNFDEAFGVQLYQDIKCNGVASDDFRVCNGHGRCILDNKCICYDNYYGYNCSNPPVLYTCFGINQAFEDEVCSGDGKCISQDKCICTKNSGPFCQCPEKYLIFIFNFGCVDNIRYFLYQIILILSISLLGSILVIITLIIGCTIVIAIIFYLRKLYKIQKNNLNKKESILYDMLRDNELENLDEDKKAWELNKKLFQIEPSEIEIIKKVGSGGEGIVFLAKWRQLDVAVKYFNCKLIPEDSLIQNFKKESGLMSSLRHPNIITFYGATLSYPRVGFILEYAPQSVDKFIESGESKKSSKEKLLNMLYEVSNAMLYLHSNSIIHRDLKWQNVLLNQFGLCKITDFGMSKIIDSSASSSLTKNIGTGFYIAPENYKGLEYDSKVDVYAFGLMIFELLCGTLNPWDLDESTKGLTLIRIASEAAHNPSFRPNVVHLINNGFEFIVPLCQECWSHDPNERPTFEEILNKIHEFLEKIKMG